MYNLDTCVCIHTEPSVKITATSYETSHTGQRTNMRPMPVSAPDKVFECLDDDDVDVDVEMAAAREGVKCRA